MIKTTVKENKAIKKYPYIGKFIGDKNFPNKIDNGLFYVLFCEPKKGIVISSQNRNRPIGYYYAEWLEERCFDHFNGTITLESN